MAALILWGIWALTLAASDEPVRAVSPPQGVPAARIDEALPTANVLPAPAPVGAAPAEPAQPPGVTREQWAAIEAEVGQRADGPAELQRLRGYLEWSDTLRRFREASADAVPAEERVALAQSLEQGLSERIRRAEVSAAEAQQIESAILALTVADDVERSERLRQWAASELAPAAAPDPRQQAFERRQVEIVSAWSALPPAARDRAALERELEVLRQQSFAPGTGSR